MPRRQNNPSGSAVRLFLYLGHRISGLDRWPPVTLCLCLGMLALHLQPAWFDFVPPVSEACLQPHRLLQGRELERFLYSAFLHADDYHLGANLSSLLHKGSVLEPYMGSLRFYTLILLLWATSQVMSVLVAWAIAAAVPAFGSAYFSSCIVGFSGVLFGLKVVASSGPRQRGRGSVLSPSTSNAAYWGELVMIQLVSPRASFLGHLAGILAGLLLVRVWNPAGQAAGARQTNWGSGRLGGSAPAPAPAASGRRRALRLPSWRQMAAWKWPAVFATLAAILAATNPGEGSFELLAKKHTSSALGGRAGWALWTLMKVQKQMGRGFRSRNLLLFSVGQYGSLYGLGILNTWIPLPLGWLQPAASLLYRQAWAAFVAFAHRTAQAGVPRTAQVVAALNLACWLLWRSADSGFIPATWPLKHLEATPSSFRRPWSFAVAPFSHASLSATTWNSLEFIMLCSNDLWGLEWTQGLLAYWMIGMLAHVLAILTFQIRDFRDGGGWRVSRGASPALAACLACQVATLALPELGFPADGVPRLSAPRRRIHLLLGLLSLRQRCVRGGRAVALGVAVGAVLWWWALHEQLGSQGRLLGKSGSHEPFWI